MSINIEKSRKLALVVDMYGCPNRCRHCWLGRLPNIPPENGADEMLVNSFRPHFEQIEYYSWLREPDFCGEYRARWERDKALSVNCEPQRFELASFWRLVRDGEYAKFLREVGVKIVQLTFFGGEETTDRYIGRKGAYSELLKATEILLQNGIAPRWQAFINAENKDEVAELPKLAEKLKLAERCRQIGRILNSLFMREAATVKIASSIRFASSRVTSRNASCRTIGSMKNCAPKRNVLKAC